MYRLIITLALISLSVSPAISEEETAKRYNVKTGIIEYSITGAKVGTETLYFDDWGRTEARIRKVSTNFPNTPKSSENILALQKDGRSYSVDLATNTGTVTNNMEVLALSGDTLPRAQMNTPTPTKIKIAGKECQVWKSTMLGVEDCLWNSLSLQTISGENKTAVTKTAKSVKLVDSLPKNAFELPDKVKLTQINLDDLFNIPTG